MGARALTWRPATTRQSVSGVETMRPTGPHSAPQKSAAAMMPKGAMPMVWPYTCGSSTLATSASSAASVATLHKASDHPGSTAAANTATAAIAAGTPTYGTNRSAPASVPHNVAWGTPRSASTTDATNPNVTFMTTSEAKKRDTPSSVSASACMVRAISFSPVRRTSRSRIESRPSIMKKSSTSTIAASPTGPQTALKSRENVVLASGRERRISTGMGAEASGAPGGSDATGCASRGSASSIDISDSQRSSGRTTIDPSWSTFVPNCARYCGSSRTTSAIWEPRTRARAATQEATKPTETKVAATWPSPSARTRRASGASVSVRMPATASGSSTGRPK